MASQKEIKQLIQQLSTNKKFDREQYFKQEEVKFQKVFKKVVGITPDEFQERELKKKYLTPYDKMLKPLQEIVYEDHSATNQEISNLIVNLTGKTFEKNLEEQMKIMSKYKSTIIPISDIINYVPLNIQILINTYIDIKDRDKCMHCDKPNYIFSVCKQHLLSRKKIIIDDFIKIIMAFVEIKKSDELTNLINYNIKQYISKIKENKGYPVPFIPVNRIHEKTKIISDILKLLCKQQNSQIVENQLIGNMADILKDYPISEINKFIDDEKTTIMADKKDIYYKQQVETSYTNTKNILSKISKQISKAITNKMLNFQVKQSLIDLIRNTFETNIGIIFNKLVNSLIYVDYKYEIFEQLYARQTKFKIKNLKLKYLSTDIEVIKKVYPFMFINFPCYGEIYNDKFNSYVPFIIAINDYKSIKTHEIIERLKHDMIAESFCLIAGINYLKLNVDDIKVDDFTVLDNFLTAISTNKKIYFVNTLNKIRIKQIYDHK